MMMYDVTEERKIQNHINKPRNWCIETLVNSEASDAVNITDIF